MIQFMEYYVIYWKNKNRCQVKKDEGEFFKILNELIKNRVMFTFNNNPILAFADIIIPNEADAMHLITTEKV